MEPAKPHPNTPLNEDLPPETHRSIIRRVSYMKMRPFFISIIVVFVVNTIILLSHINNALMGAEFSDMIADFTQDSFVDMFILSILFERFFEIISVEILASLLLNLAGFLYIVNRLFSYRFKLYR